MNSNTRFPASFWLFASLPILFFLLFAFDGMDVADRGFIPALAHRILSGEVIYHDFFYVRPPLTPYLHTFEMALFPESWEMLAYRFFFYAFMWLPIYWSVRSLERYFDFGRMGISAWFLASIGFVISVHNFFQAPWHTVDGIFFSALGFFCLTKSDKYLPIAAGIFCFGLSALAKQPFGIVPIVGLGLAVFLHGWKKAIFGGLAAIALATLVLVTIELTLTPNYSFLSEMLGQTSGVSSLNELRWGGYQLYVRPAAIAFIVGFGVWALLKYVFKSTAPGWPMAILAAIGFAVVGWGMVGVTMQHGSFVQPKAGFVHGLVFIGGAIAGLSFLKRDRKGNAIILAMTAVAWASGISWGYAIPILYCFPAVFAIGYFLGEIAKFQSPRWYWPSILAVTTASIFTLNYYVYHESNRPGITHDLGAVFNKLSHIQAGDEQFAHYSELKSLHAKYGDNFTVLPSMPIANYVTNTQPQLATDWAHDAEVNYEKGIDKLTKQLVQNQITVFALRTELGRANEDGHYRCSTLKYVLDNWNRVDSTRMFYVYQLPFLPK